MTVGSTGELPLIRTCLSVLIRGVASFQGVNLNHDVCIHWDLNTGVASFQGSRLE